MQHTAPTTRLLPLQTRVINASNGMRLRVVSGHFWLTQPNATQDLFLGPGACVDLRQDWVVIGADAGSRPPADAPPCYSEYLLMPLVASASRWAAPALLLRTLMRLGRRACASAPSASGAAR